LRRWPVIDLQNTIFETIGDEIVALAAASSNLAISGVGFKNSTSVDSQ
jgi:hypothetical protein